MSLHSFLFFLFHCPTKICTRFSQISGNKHDGIETLAHCAEWSQFVVDTFFSNLTYFTGVVRSSQISLNCQQHTIATPVLLLSNGIMKSCSQYGHMCIGNFQPRVVSCVTRPHCLQHRRSYFSF